MRTSLGALLGETFHPSVTPTDPLVLGAVSLVLVAVALGASYVSAGGAPLG
jgi:hypothetical protein